MKNTLKIALSLAFGMLSCLVAKSELHYFDLQKALNNEQVKAKLPQGVEFAFGLGSGEGTQIISQNLQITQRHKRAFANSLSVEYSCQMALAKALTILANRANILQASKVVNIVGYTNSKGIKGVFNSAEKFECLVKHTGAKVKVTLQADFAK